MNMVELKLLPHSQLAAAAANNIAERINAAVEARGHCYCALSGGSSPQPMLAILAASQVPWNQVTLLIVDERYTNIHTQQNQTMLQDFIRQIPDAPPQLITLLTGSSYEDTLTGANARVDTCPAQLDLVVLGMGLDGHTASLFPDAAEYQSAMTSTARYVEVQPGTAPHRRISMSFHWIASARSIVLYIPGKDKLNCYRALHNNPDAISPIRDLASTASQLTIFSSED